MLLFIPTYNERDNVARICDQILALKLSGLQVLFIDDNSADGTGAELDRLAREHADIKVIHRASKLGIGSAHQAGIDYAYKHKHTQLITMDCDGTHPPEYLPQFLALSAAAGADIVVGSRYLNPGSLDEWSLFRRLLTYSGHALTTTLLQMPYDASSAYRCYRLDRIPQSAFHLVKSPGYSFFFESLYVLALNQFQIKEVGIVLPARACGQSKMSFTEAGRGLLRLLHMCISIAARRRQYLLREA